MLGKWKGRFVRLPRCRRALVWLVSFLFVFDTIPTGVFADVIVNADPQQNTTSENLSNESTDSASVSGGGSVEASSNDNSVSSDDQNPESDVSDKQSNDVNVNETSDESNSDAAESGVYQVNDQSTFEDALKKSPPIIYRRSDLS